MDYLHAKNYLIGYSNGKYGKILSLNMVEAIRTVLKHIEELKEEKESLIHELNMVNINEEESA